MKNTLTTIGCVIGGLLVGFFANQLTTLIGGIFFTVGVLLLAVSIYLRTKKENNQETTKTELMQCLILKEKQLS